MPQNNEAIWSFWGMNVGTASVMVDSNSTTGVGAGLYYGEGLGLTGVEAVDNDMVGALENNINGTQTFQMIVNKSAFTYDYYRGGVLRASDVPFANNQTVLDQYRIGADNFAYSVGEEQTMDNVKVVLNVADDPEETLDPETTRTLA